MTQIQRLITNYRRFVSIPWASSRAGAQRVWFAVYPPAEERRVRARVEEFACATREAKHGWKMIDITDLPARWLAANDYRDAYFAEPAALATIEDDLRAAASSELRNGCQADDVDCDTVVAVLGAGSFFGFTHLSGIIAQVEADIRGRLLIFFPGEYERNLYRFMDARDGFNYMAVPITCSERLLI